MQIVKPFLDPRTARKVKFVYSDDAESMKILDSLFDKDKVDASLADDDFDLAEYAKLMQSDDEKAAITWNLRGSGGGADTPHPIPNLSTLKLNTVNSSSQYTAPITTGWDLRWFSPLQQRYATFLTLSNTNFLISIAKAFNRKLKEFWQKEGSIFQIVFYSYYPKVIWTWGKATCATHDTIYVFMCC